MTTPPGDEVERMKRYKKYWVRERHIVPEDQYVNSQIEPMKLKLMIYASDLDAAIQQAVAAQREKDCVTIRAACDINL